MQQTAKQTNNTRSGGPSAGNALSIVEGLKERQLNRDAEVFGPLLRLLRAMEKGVISTGKPKVRGQLPLADVLRKVAKKAEEKGIAMENVAELRDSHTKVLHKDLQEVCRLTEVRSRKELDDALGKELASELSISLSLEMGSLKYLMTHLLIMERLASSQGPKAV
jgi:hypothetical protein